MAKTLAYFSDPNVGNLHHGAGPPVGPGCLAWTQPGPGRCSSSSRTRSPSMTSCFPSEDYLDFLQSQPHQYAGPRRELSAFTVGHECPAFPGSHYLGASL
ncbi:Histone deacetylase 3 [Sciurus carolinensis]|uniref:Histone deacetylase 3 n=1 Tax=Sciurus carolinensis TaxID=30640 RepID=A0AA41MMD0_SCICA|nr:Histone deacetylase 3 [Sciurus carolinensis]